jgi:hypothetical protein
VGALAASGGDRCDRPAGEVAALWGKWVRRRALVDAREGGEGLGLVYSRPGLELAAVASNGAGGGSTVAWPGQEGQRPYYRGKVCLPATQETNGDV